MSDKIGKRVIIRVSPASRADVWGIVVGKRGFFYEVSMFGKDDHVFYTLDELKFE